jgi:hypothetical protein
MRVVSLAVLEHVQDPFRCAAEITRVLKPGGSLYCQVPLLAPVHAYPDHYYNMTQRGLQRLFKDAVAVERIGVLNLGQPIYTVSWVLNEYVNGLPFALQKEFKALKVVDLLEGGLAYIGKDYVTHLSPEAQERIACVNFLSGTKRV